MAPPAPPATAAPTAPTTSSGLSKSASPSGFNPSASFVHSQTQAFPALSATDSSSASSTCSSSCGKAVTRTQLRTLLASSMSSMYRAEVPLYGDLLSIIGSVNATCLRAKPDALSDDEISRLNVERHGAIRVGTRQELALLARIFKVFGMQSVGYYDLWKDAGLPIHATAFRPRRKEELLKNPFRIFCSLLRMDLITDPTTRRLAEELLGRRKIVSDRCVELLVKAERGEEGEGEGRVKGLTREEALEFVERVVDIFAWHSDTEVRMEEYKLLSATHPLVADIALFRGPHINHLTPRTLDIDEVQRTMIRHGIDAKDVIEGPPARENPIYLRQTSFHALSEKVSFLGEEGKHKARFGEIEARGQALTHKGARLYDKLMQKAAEVKREKVGRGERVGKEECVEVLKDVFEKGFTDDRLQLLRDALGFWAFSVKDEQLASNMMKEMEEKKGGEVLAEMVRSGALDAEPITYEDFLPASAAGIFQSNLPQQPAADATTWQKEKADEVDFAEAKERFERAVGGTILDYFELYRLQQRDSLDAVAKQLGIDMEEVINNVEEEGM